MLYHDGVDLPCLKCDDSIDEITEEVERIKERGTIEGWYNLTKSKGRIFLKLQWMDLKPLVEEEMKDSQSELMGVLCVLIGKLRSPDLIRPTIFMDFMNPDDDNGAIKLTSLDSLSTNTKFTFNEGKLFRVK